MAKAPQITPNTPQDVVLRLSQRQAGVQVTQGLLDDIQGIIDSEGPLVSNSLRWQQLDRIADLIMALTGALQPPRSVSTPEQEAQATENLDRVFRFARSYGAARASANGVVLGRLHYRRRRRRA